jgi:hypothetical protein
MLDMEKHLDAQSIFHFPVGTQKYSVGGIWVVDLIILCRIMFVMQNTAARLQNGLLSVPISWME